MTRTAQPPSDRDARSATLAALGRRASRPREADLLAAATRLFRQRGFHATSMQDLADALGMNRGSLYHYIRAKDDLLWRIVSGVLDRLDARVRPILESDLPPEARLRSAIDEHLRFAVENTDPLTLVQIELRSLLDGRRQALIGRRDAYEALWRRAIEDGIAAGVLRPVDIRLAGIAILSVCNWFTQWYRSDGPLAADEIGRRFADLFVNGLAAAHLPAGERAAAQAAM